MQLNGTFGFHSEPGVDSFTLATTSRCVPEPAHETLLTKEASAVPTERHVAAMRATAAAAAALSDPSGSDPAGTSFEPHLASSEFLDNVAQAQPEHADRDGCSLPRNLVVDGHFALVRLVDVDLKVFVPAVVSRPVSACSRRVFDFDVDDRLGRVFRFLWVRSVREIASRLDGDLQGAGERSSQVRLEVLGDACECSLSVAPFSLLETLLNRKCTVFVLAEFAHDVQGLVLFESLAQEHHLLLRLDPLILRISSADSTVTSSSKIHSRSKEWESVPSLLVSVRHVQLRHLVDSFLVLTLDVQFELELMQHARDLGGREWRVGFDQVCKSIGERLAYPIRLGEA